ncbi:MAG: Eco57I restriction-modification methylase domain-containing protein [Bacteroidia bacterium]|nr:Eco57I restriction-modification methylase domain-containing protein [Bacteroidia bacterium]
MNAVKNFHTDTFINALKSFFRELNVPINYLADAPTDAETILEHRYNPQNKAHALINEVYVLGVVDDAIFGGKNTFQDITELKNIKKDYDGLLIIGIKLHKRKEGLPPTRSQLAEITRTFNQTFPYTPVSIVFQYANLISFANTERISYKQTWREGEKIGKVTMLKEVNTLKPHAAHLRILTELQLKPNVKSFIALNEQWLKVLTTKELNNQFFKKIANWYFWAVANAKFPYEYLQKEDKYKDDTPEKLQELANQKAMIRFITRIIFVWFLKEKKLVPENLFDQEYIAQILKDFDSDKSGNYYLAILQNLFFATLNRPAEQRNFAPDEGYLKNRATDFDVNSLYRYEKAFKAENTEKIMTYFANIPFLNGGLFDSLDKKTEKIVIDGFTRNSKWNPLFPNFLLFGEATTDFSPQLNEIYQTKKAKYEVKGLFHIFDEYKFTVEENTPDEQDIALDPVLLGEIFENLLAYYNPETATTARKGTGSFYTPQEIVNYMVEESIKAYLQNQTQNPNLNFVALNTLSLKEREEIVKHIANIKILDPACGSGAFPMGVLHKIVKLLKDLDPDNKIWQGIQKQKLLAELDRTYDIQDKAIRETEIQKLNDVFEKNLEDYGRKLYLIRNCIYGVDIQDVAIQISKLRFFLSLVIDQSNENIQPLPNLETKFVVANTLIGIDLPLNDAFGGEDPTQEIRTELKKVREQHFNASNRTEKQKLKKQDEKLRNDLALIIENTLITKRTTKLNELNDWMKLARYELAEAEQQPTQVEEVIVEDLFGEKQTHKINKTREKIKAIESRIFTIEKQIQKSENHTWENQIINTAKNLAKWDIYNQNAQAQWFDTDWMFGIKDGFDVVIGNPPYVGISKLKDKEILQKQNFATFESTGDLYALFYEKGNQLLKNGGILAFITSNKWLRASYGKSLRKYFIEKTNPLKLIDFGQTMIFESAIVHSNIFIFQRSNNQKILQAVQFEQDLYKNNLTIDDYFNNYNIILSHIDDNIWSIIVDTGLKIKEKIEKIGKPLKYWDIQFNRGILTGFNEAFIVDDDTKNALINQDSKNAEILKPVLRGRDVRHYYCNFANLWLIHTHNGIRSDNIERINVIKDYPTIYNYLLNFEKEAISRYDKGTHWTNLRNCAYLNEIEKPKIIFSEIVSEPQFHYDTKGYYPEATVFFITGENLKYLIALLNSKPVTYFFTKFYAGGELVGKYRYKKAFLENLPIPNISEMEQQPFIELVDKILTAKQKQADTKQLESEIDQLVYRLYDLTEEEIAIIEKPQK